MTGAGVAEPSEPVARLGLPEAGPGSPASFAVRVAAFVVDLVAGALIGSLITVFVPDADPLQRNYAMNAAFAAEVIVLQALTGQSLGMRLLGIRVLSLRTANGVPGFVGATVRTALLMLVIPALIFDRLGRGLHDKAAGTVVVQAR